MFRRLPLVQRILFNCGLAALAPAVLVLFGAMVRLSHGRPLPLFLFYVFAGSIAVAAIPFSIVYLLQQRPGERIRPAVEGLTLNVGVRRGRLLLSMLGWFFPLWLGVYLLGRPVIAEGNGTLSGIVAFATVFLAGRRLLFAEHLLRINGEGLHHYRYGTIRWTDIGGLRLDSQTFRNADEYWLALLLLKPERYLSQLPGRFHMLLHFWLRRRLTLRIPLAYSTVSAAAIYDAAIFRRHRFAPPPLLGCTGGAAARAVAALADAIAREGGETAVERASRLRRSAWPQWTAADTAERLVAKLPKDGPADPDAADIVGQIRELTDQFNSMARHAEKRRHQWLWVAVIAAFAFVLNVLLRFTFG